MNTAITINLGGAAFYIDNDAYSTLQAYLLNIEKNLSSDTDKREVMRDIEARIAELFNDLLKRQHVEVVTAEMVHAVMEQLGKPSDFNLQEDEPSETGKNSTGQFFKKKIYRDPDNRLIGGVCSGLGYWLGINSIWVRLLFLLGLFLWAATLPLYLILWLIMPEARTAAQKLDMRGEEPSIENIEREVKDISSRPAPASGGCLVTGLKICLWTIGGFFLFVAVTVIFAVLTGVLGAFTGIVALSPFSMLGSAFSHDCWLTALMIVLDVIAICLPVIGLVYALVKYSRKGERTSPKAIIICFCIWLAALLGSIGIGIYTLTSSEEVQQILSDPDTYESLIQE